MKIVADKVAVDAATAEIVAGFKRMGEVADAVGKAAVSVQEAAEGIAAPRRAMSWWAAASWADLLGRFTGR